MLTDKIELRKKFRQLRRELSAEQQQEASTQALQIIVNHRLLEESEHIALYLSRDGELSCHEIIQWCWQNSKKTYLPVLDPDQGQQLLFVEYTEQTPMLNNRFAIPEPVIESSNVTLIDQLDCIFLPLVAFDDNGNRLGMGGGFYDRTLAEIDNLARSPQLFGFAHDCQQASSLSTESWDIPVHKIVTPSRIISV